MSEWPAPNGPRVVIYVRDAYGVGQLRRAIAICRAVRDRWPEATSLILTGVPVPHLFRFPEGVDYVKLPSVERTGFHEIRSRVLPLTATAMRDLRSALVLEIARHFPPDVFVVDTYPSGFDNDVLPALEYLKETSPDTRLVLSLRDIIADPEQVCDAWRRGGIYRLLDEIYDLILVFGVRAVHEIEDAYGLSSRAAGRVRYLGYLRRPSDGPQAHEIRARLRVGSRRLVLVTAGSGIDGYPLLDAAITGVAARPDAVADRYAVVMGPLMPTAHRQRLAQRAAGVPAVALLDAVEDLTAYIAAADLVVSMGGYNTISEILSADKPAIIVPRMALGGEQYLRATAMSRQGWVSMIHPTTLTPDGLMDAVALELNGGLASSRCVPLDGAVNLVSELERCLGSGRRWAGSST